jgi:F0F1-type ATP synthase membrane subunit a
MIRLLNSLLKEIAVIFLIVLLGFLLFPKKAYAYIDPGTGSIILQVALGFVVAGLVTLKLFWTRIIVWFKKLTRHQVKNG